MPYWKRPIKPILFICTLLSFVLASSSCSTTSRSAVEQLPSKNYSYRVKSLVMHFTAVDFKASVEALVDEGNVSSHYLIPRLDDPTYPHKEMKTFQLVNEEERAWHAGISYWQGRSGLNDHSIGIEIVNQPECQQAAPVDASLASVPPQIIGAEKDRDLCIFPDFEEAQIAELIRLTKEILARNPDITPTSIVGHSDIAPSRKNDPGPRFPWYRLYQEGIGAWYDNESLTQHWLAFNQTQPSLGLVQNALAAYGYGVVATGRMDQQTIDTIAAFQMHFLPWQVTGEPNNQTAAAIFALLEKYFPNEYQQLNTIYQSEVLSAQINLTEVASNIQQAQIARKFTNPVSDALQYVDNRAQFFAYKGRGEVLIESSNAKSLSLFVNGQMLDIGDIKADKINRYSLHKRTVDGLNTLRVENISPQDASIKITVPYPTLAYDLAQHKKKFASIDKYIREEISKGFPGLNLAIVHKGKIIKRTSYGYARKFNDIGAELENYDNLTSEHMFDLASNTKVFATSLAIMQLVNQGALDIEKPLQYYIPEFRNNGREVIRVKDLLSHRSGYANELKFYRPDNRLSPFFYSQNPVKTKRLLLTALPLEAASGSAQIYSDSNFMILGTLIERISGTPLDEYLYTNIFEPLRLKNTHFNPLQKGFDKAQFAATEISGNTRDGNIDFPNIREYVLQGEVHDEKAFYSMGGVSGHAGLFSNTDDLAVLMQLLLNGGGYGDVKIFNHATLSRFISPSGHSDSLGLGWQLASDSGREWHFGPYASKQAYGHTGWTGTATIIDPKYDLGIIILTNKRHSKIQQIEDGFEFEAESSRLAKYGNLVSLIYEVLLSDINN